ncbi:ATP F0F1 synthase subunit delta [Colwellia sp. PAMC 20917]|jgi:F-type H+-transporting ATPase subunit delta|uniref:F0F1 ATP synthase subunit delta n=1 Tax=unclassified Colwellia TaxID=196834 RepID=UPI0008782699|nr:MULTISPECIES: F0F1 ATP synthase subunit delta [unclassified Colwellia]MBA6363132.1 F0F1 ATP synthase subunit delta [Colwellia sp. BRX8-8]AOW77243.1 ATP F0F1 synthase subunit delta [Colwellia sp. PAMC 20917]MBA6253563.1 F0F1 ATP synthase subunit delta [Colwellia sp. MB3u-55]MBA6263321.1 F0F1 ATP synthase subunit delta [Colwellia sp. Bg11-12]MBA6338268.1 F0F1 ATP synthase subunit delta [Colwellia sp. BRX8-7]|tara:strand:+ start:1423 stop:1956 length:534 start_codon:yes stop_codon:yes gene_type:complete
MSELTTVARPYAKAAFDFAVEAKAIDSWLSQLTFAAEVAKDETIKGVLSGGASVEQAQALFLSVCGEQIDSQGQNFLKIMAENERLLVLPHVLTQFLALKAEFEQEVTVDVTSAVEITAEQKTTLSAALVKRLARKVKLNCIVDATIISGLIIKADDMVIDGSIQGKLSRLATILQS